MSDFEHPTGKASGRSTFIPILLLILLDIGFNTYFWRIPKLTEPWDDYGYQFLLETHRLHQPKPPGATRVVALGSSVSGSFDRYQVESLIEAKEPLAKVDAHRLLVPGMKPSDYRLYLVAERASMQADVVVVIVNVADFLNPAFDRDLEEQVRYVLPPWHTLWERHAYMSSFASELDLLLASVSNLYRYRKAIRSCIEDHTKQVITALRHRASDQAYGLYPDGYTRPVFGLPIDHAAEFDLQYFVSPAWIQQRGRVKIEFSVSGRRLAERIERAPGWNTIRLKLPPTRSGVLKVVADGAWNPRAAGINEDARLLGLRLRDAPAGGAHADTSWAGVSTDHRQLREFLRMGDAVGQQFIDRWWRAVAADTPFGERMRAYQKSILGMRRKSFSEHGEYGELERLIADLSEHGVAVALVNSPESPLIFSQYEDSPYYRAYVRFMRELANRYARVRFYDLANALPVEDFNDWHHVNYIGAIKLGPRYAEIVRRAMAEREGGQ